MIEGPKSEDIRNLFSTVAHGYDTANDAMTFGLARRWRKQVVAWSGAKAGDHILDCATGTGDLAIEFKHAVGGRGMVIGTDFCESMLNFAPGKAKKRGLDVEFELADVLKLPFASDRFEVSSIAYGIRNVEDPVKGLSELARVVKPGGRVMVLETGDTPNGALKGVMNFYIRQVVPRVGGWITGQRGAYEYLNNSSRGFPSRERFLEMMRETGVFRSVEYRALLGGASFIYRGVVS